MHTEFGWLNGECVCLSCGRSWVCIPARPKIIKIVQTVSVLGTQASGWEVGSAAWLYNRLGSVWNCLWGCALYKSPGINYKSRVLYLTPRWPPHAAWPSMLKKHYNELINQMYNLVNELKSMLFSRHLCIFSASIFGT